MAVLLACGAPDDSLAMTWREPAAGRNNRGWAVDDAFGKHVNIDWFRLMIKFAYHRAVR